MLKWEVTEIVIKCVCKDLPCKLPHHLGHTLRSEDLREIREALRKALRADKTLHNWRAVKIVRTCRGGGKTAPNTGARSYSNRGRRVVPKNCTPSSL